MPPAVRIAPQAAAPPSSSSATIGPSTPWAPQAMFPTPKLIRLTQSQRRSRTARHPSASSVTNGRRSATSTEPTRSMPRIVALAAKVAASIANTQPGPIAATINPDSAGPTIQLALRFSANRAFAF